MNEKDKRMFLGLYQMLLADSEVHPKELEIAHRYYTPSEQEISDAEEMLRLFNEAQAMNKGVAVLNGKFIGPPMVVAAKKILKKAKLVEEKVKKIEKSQ